MPFEIKKWWSLLFLNLIFASFLSCGTSKNMPDDKLEKTTVEVTVNFTSDYCGGAYPSEDILSALKKPRLMTNQKIFIVKEGNGEEAINEVKTSEKGIFSTDLEPGKYNIFLPEKMSDFIGKMASKEICENWKKTPNGTFEVVENVKVVSASVYKTCSPCVDPAR